MSRPRANQITASLFAGAPRPGTPGRGPQGLFTDGFEGVLDWTPSGTGTGYTVANNATAKRTGAQGLYLKTRVTGAAQYDTVQGARTLALPSATRVTASAWVCLPTGHVAFDIYWNVSIRNGATYWSHGFAWEAPTGQVFRRTAAWAWAAVAALNTALAADTWYHVTLVLDPVNQQYVSLTLGTKTASLAGLTGTDGGASGLTTVGLGASISSAGAAAATGFFDDIEITYLPP